MCLRPGDLDVLVKQVLAQLKRIAITDKPRVDEMFLRYNTARTGYISRENMRDLCYRLQLPVDDDVIAAVSFVVCCGCDHHVLLCNVAVTIMFLSPSIAAEVVLAYVHDCSHREVKQGRTN